jgi:hypothetical protein
MRKNDYVEILTGEYKGHIARVVLVENMIDFKFVNVEITGVKPYPFTMCYKDRDVKFYHRELKRSRVH